MNDEWQEIFKGLWRFKSHEDLVKALNQLALDDAVNFRKDISDFVNAPVEMDVCVRVKKGGDS